MKIINAVGSRLPGMVIGLAQQKAATLARSVKLRPYRKTLVYTTDATQDIYIIIIQLGISTGGDRVVIVNGNEFRIESAVDEVLGDNSVWPTLKWKGGTPPFIIKLVWLNPYDGGFYDEDVTASCVNVNNNLTDGTGDLVLEGESREYIITKIDDSDAWWADDLGTEDLGFDETTNEQKRQNAIGIQITDSATPPRSLFAPFAPDPIYETDGLTPAGLFAKYPEGRFGPHVWCLPIVQWDQPAAITYGTALQVGIQLDAYVHIPGTTTPLPGIFAYWLDGDHTVPAENVAPDADTGLPLYATFQATDSFHYHLAKAIQGLIVNKATQAINNLTAFHNTKSVIYWGSELSHVQIRPGETATVSAYVATAFNSGNLIQFNSSSSACVAGASVKVTELNHKATLTFNQAGAFYVTALLQGNNNFDAAIPINSVTFKVGFGMNEPGGVSFDINDTPITYGEALDVLCWSPVSGDLTYQTEGEPAGWIVDPLPGTYLETNSDGTPHAYSITALFYPLDTVNYPSPMEYEQWLTVGKNMPVPVWTTADSFVYGMTWFNIMNALLFNSHHVGVGGWAVQQNALYTVSGHSKSQWNGIISDALARPDVDSGIFVSCEFFLLGDQAHNYETPPPTDPLDHGFTITPKPIQVVATNYNKTFSTADPALAFTAIGLLGTDQATGTLVRDTGENVGTYIIRQGTVTAGDNYTIQFSAGTFTINKMTLVIVAINASKLYGQADPSFTYTANGAPGPFSGTTGSLSRTSGTDVGTYSIQQGTLDAGGNYYIAFTAGTLTINKANQILGTIATAWTAGPGNPAIGGREVMIGDTAVISISSSGASGEPVTYTSSNTSVCSVSGTGLTIVGIGTFNVIAHQAGNTNYNAAIDKNGIPLTTVKTPATVSSANASVTYNGSQQTAAGITSPTGLSVSYTYNGSSTPPTNAGTYTVVGTINDTRYTGSGSWTLTIGKATPAVTWTTPTVITYGTAVSASVSPNIPGTWSYSCGSVPNATSGQIEATATFTPTDSANYNTDWDGGWLTVNKAASTIAWPSPAVITYGSNLSAFYQQVRNLNTHGIFVFDMAESTVPNATSGATYAIGYVFTPNNSNYLTLDDGGWLQVNKAPQIVAFVLNDTDIYVGQTAYMSLTAVNQAAGGGGVAYSSGNSSIASVSGTSVYGAAAGAVYITVVQAETANFAQGSFSVYLNVHVAVSFWTKTLDDCPGQSLPAGFYLYNLDGPSGGNYYTGNAILIAYTGTYPNRTRWTFIWSDLFCDEGYEERNGYTNFVFSTGQCDGTAVDYSLAQIEAAGGSGGIPGSPGISRWLFTETGILQTEYCRGLSNTARYFLVRKETESMG